MATMHCEIVSAEKELFSGEIKMLSARGTVGELGIMPGHAPLLTGIQAGTVILRLEDDSEEIFFCLGWFFRNPAWIRNCSSRCCSSRGRH
jgi:F-type H+-transporting ATPase subunit epsilon